MFKTLISANGLHAHLEDPNFIIVDCRFQLADSDWGRQTYLDSHIPGAVYAHLDEDLSGPPATDNGRHPLPTPDALNALFSRLGISQDSQVVAYDNANGMIAARLWWMLRYMGHDLVAVLDGGWAAWQESGFRTASGPETNKPTRFEGTPNPSWLVRMNEVSDADLLIDSRAPGRYAGESEPIDAQAGHIPGAVNYFFQNNWDDDGRYLPSDQLALKMKELLGDTDPDEAVFYCGSGVSACANLLALADAGLGNGRLYVGSWSEWSRDSNNPIETS